MDATTNGKTGGGRTAYLTNRDKKGRGTDEVGGVCTCDPTKTMGDGPGTPGGAQGTQAETRDMTGGDEGARGGTPPPRTTRRLGTGIPGGDHRNQVLQGGRTYGDREGEKGITFPKIMETGPGTPGGGPMDPGNG